MNYERSPNSCLEIAGLAGQNAGPGLATDDRVEEWMVEEAASVRIRNSTINDERRDKFSIGASVWLAEWPAESRKVVCFVVSSRRPSR